jgi:hypothetical protein
MTLSKHHSLRRIALGLVVAALVPAAAQARPLDVSGEDARVIHAQALPRDASAVVGAEDLAFSRRPTSTAAATTADSKDRYDAGIGSVAGLALMLAAAGAAIVVHHSRKARLSPA